MRTLDQIDADIAAIEAKALRPQRELLLDPTGEKGFGAAAVTRLRDYEAQLDTLRAERREGAALTNS